jgi:hypothetical protein
MRFMQSAGINHPDIRSYFLLAWAVLCFRLFDHFLNNQNFGQKRSKKVAVPS